MLHAKLTNSYESTHVHAYGESCKMIIIINYHCDLVTVLNSLHLHSVAIKIVKFITSVTHILHFLMQVKFHYQIWIGHTFLGIITNAV